LLYQTLFENGGDPANLLSLPYPLYNDIILKQIEEKKKEKKLYEQKMQQMRNKQKSAQAKYRRR
jgi:hypothetical protein